MITQSGEAEISRDQELGKGRSLVEAKGLEIENAFFLAFKLSQRWSASAKEVGFRFKESLTHSVYLEVVEEICGHPKPTLDLLKNGITLRLRRGGKAVLFDKKTNKNCVCESFSNEFAIKRLHPEFQKIAHRISKNLFPEAESAGVYPRIREEIEGEHEHPEASSEMRFEDLPDGEEWKIRSIIGALIDNGKIEGAPSRDELVMRPIATTTVFRQRADFYIDPTQPIDFENNWPSPELTSGMKETGVWLRVEVAIDRCINRKPPADATISDVLKARGEDFANFKRLGRRPLFEYEVKKCGSNTTDEQAIDGYIRFGLALREYVRKAGHGHVLKPARSKAVNAIGGLRDCEEGGRLHSIYQNALKIAP